MATLCNNIMDMLKIHLCRIGQVLRLVKFGSLLYRKHNSKDKPSLFWALLLLKYSNVTDWFHKTFEYFQNFLAEKLSLQNFIFSSGDTLIFFCFRWSYRRFAPNNEKHKMVDHRHYLTPPFKWVLVSDYYRVVLNLTV